MSEALCFLSLVKKSGHLKSGEYAVKEALITQSVYLVILAGDASENTKKKFYDKAGFRNIPIVEISTKEELGRAIGKEFAASIAICDKGLADTFAKKLGGI